MPLIRYTYHPDVLRNGDQPILVEEVEAKVLTEMRRAVRVTEAELAALPKEELAQVAEEVGANVPKKASKVKVVKAIGEAEGQ